MTFTDVDLDPHRTTRVRSDPEFDRLDAPVRGDLILVDTSAYGLPGVHWCRFVYVAPGSASVYPYKAEVPERGVGQWRAGEIAGWARPVEVHRVLDAPRRRTELERVRTEQNLVAQVWQRTTRDGERTLLFRRMLALIERERLLELLLA